MRNVYWSRPSVCLRVRLSLIAFPHYCTNPVVSWANGRGGPVVVDLQSVHIFRCYDNITPNTKCQRVLLYSLYAWFALLPMSC